LRVETIYSLSGEMPAAEIADEGEGESVLRPGALIAGSVRRACAVRKLSAGGAILHCDHDVEIGEQRRNGERRLVDGAAHYLDTAGSRLRDQPR
jgi:hypothetical protein